VEYLETNDYDVEMIKKVINEFGMQALPNYNRLNIRESIYYLNVGRTLHRARAHYTPTGKVNANVHFFKARESAFKHQGWKNYCHRQINLYKLNGDHFSIFRKPQVVPFAETFNSILKKIYKNKS
jgi:surfactin family lipopeptide synthetase A/fengycin family lipopeptide synthetase D